MLADLVQRQDNAIVEQQNIGREISAFRRLVYTCTVELVNLLWPADMPVAFLQPEKVLIPSNLWGLCGPESPDGEDEGE
jgi:hypothetical protein